MRLWARCTQADAEDDVDEEGVAASWVVRVGRDAREEGRAELEQARQLLPGRERLGRVEVAARLVVGSASLDVARDEALQRRAESAESGKEGNEPSGRTAEAMRTRKRSE